MMTSPRVLNRCCRRSCASWAGSAGCPTSQRDRPSCRAATRATSTWWWSAAGRPGWPRRPSARAPGSATLLVDEQDRAGRLAAGASRRRRAPRPTSAQRRGARRRRRDAVGATAIAWYPEDGRRAPRRACSRCHAGGAGQLTAERYVYATGGYDLNALFADNDRPGVLRGARGRAAAGALRRRRRPSGRWSSATGPTRARSPRAGRARRRGDARRRRRERVVAARGHALGQRVDVESERGRQARRVNCDLVAVAALPAPASELPRQQGVAGRARRRGRRLRLRHRRRRPHARAIACARAATSPAISAPSARGGAHGAARRRQRSPGSLADEHQDRPVPLRGRHARRPGAHASRSATLDIEEVKRYTGFGTGPCQGKECIVALRAARATRPAAHRRRCAVHVAPAAGAGRRSARSPARATTT